MRVAKRILCCAGLLSGAGCSPLAAPPRAAVMIAENQPLYVGLPTMLTIVASEYSCHHTIALSQELALERSTDCEYYATPDTAGLVTITVAGIRRHDTIPVGVVRFPVRKLPPPKARIGSNRQGTIRVAELKANLGVSAVLEGVDIDARYNVTQFAIAVFTASGSCQKSPLAKGAFFSAAMKALINEVAKGDMLLVLDMKVDGPGVKDLSVAPLLLQVE